MNMELFNVLNNEEIYEISGGSLKEVVQTVAGVCGAVAGGAAGFVGGFTAAGNIFTPTVSVPVGIGCAGAAGALGYAGAHEAAGATYDVISDFVSSIFK